jgi:hypothetical protein
VQRSGAWLLNVQQGSGLSFYRLLAPQRTSWRGAQGRQGTRENTYTTISEVAALQGFLSGRGGENAVERIIYLFRQRFLLMVLVRGRAQSTEDFLQRLKYIITGQQQLPSASPRAATAPTAAAVAERVQARAAEAERVSARDATALVCLT